MCTQKNSLLRNSPTKVLYNIVHIWPIWYCAYFFLTHEVTYFGCFCGEFMSESFFVAVFSSSILSIFRKYNNPYNLKEKKEMVGSITLLENYVHTKKIILLRNCYKYDSKKVYISMFTSSLTSTSVMPLIPFWTCSKSIIMWMAPYWIQQLPQILFSL